MIDHVAKTADISKAAASRALDSVVAAIKTTLKKNGSVTLVGFGTFRVSKRKARTGRNPRTNQADQNPRRESAEVHTWQSVERCCKIIVFAVDVERTNAGS